MEDEEDVLESTAREALACRWSMAMAFKQADPQLEAIMSQLHLPKQLKAPIINRGTFIRWHTLNAELSAACQDPVVVSLGAGYDTRGIGQQHWIEIDQETVIARKLHILKRLHLPPCRLLAMDLNQPSFSHLESLISGAGRPLLVLAECCLMYLEPAVVEAWAAWIARHGGTLLAFEPIEDCQPFARGLQTNLAQRGIHLHFPLEQLRGKFAHVQVSSMLQLEGALLSHLDTLDEREEWTMMASSYALIKCRN